MCSGDVWKVLSGAWTWWDLHSSLRSTNRCREVEKSHRPFLITYCVLGSVVPEPLLP